jgi:hypothetical protein
VRYLRLGAWSIFLLDAVVLMQLLYNLLTQRGGPEAVAALRGLTVLLGSVLLGVAVLLIVSSWLRSREGLWISMVIGAVPLFFAVNAIVEGIWE